MERNIKYFTFELLDQGRIQKHILEVAMIRFCKNIITAVILTNDFLNFLMIVDKCYD